MNTFLKWWLLVTLTVAGIVTGWYFDFAAFIYTHDLTKLTIVIGALFVATTIVIGYKLWHKVRNQRKVVYEKEWFISELCISLGMIGTVIGFIYMLYSVFGNLNIADTVFRMKMFLSKAQFL